MTPSNLMSGKTTKLEPATAAFGVSIPLQR
jgi:hypothetical protein